MDKTKFRLYRITGTKRNTEFFIIDENHITGNDAISDQNSYSTVQEYLGFRGTDQFSLLIEPIDDKVQLLSKHQNEEAIYTPSIPDELTGMRLCDFLDHREQLLKEEQEAKIEAANNMSDIICEFLDQIDDDIKTYSFYKKLYRDNNEIRNKIVEFVLEKLN